MNRKLSVLVGLLLLGSSLAPAYAEIGVAKVSTAPKQKSSGGVKIFSSCSAYGNNGQTVCSIDCPVGKSAVCTPGGAFAPTCECR